MHAVLRWLLYVSCVGRRCGLEHRAKFVHVKRLHECAQSRALVAIVAVI